MVARRVGASHGDYSRWARGRVRIGGVNGVVLPSIDAGHSMLSPYGILLRQNASGALCSGGFADSVEKFKRAGETPALRKPKPAFAEHYGAHRASRALGGISLTVTGGEG